MSEGKCETEGKFALKSGVFGLNHDKLQKHDAKVENNRSDALNKTLIQYDIM